MHQTSIWEKESFFEQQDFIIVGSGLVGLWSAFFLQKSNPSATITLIEKYPVPTGASTRNAGFSCFGSPSELILDAEHMGEEAMWQLVKKRYEGLLEIRKHFSDDEIQYAAIGGYECFSNDVFEWDRFLEKKSWLNKGLKAITGKHEVFTIADEKLNRFGFAGFDHLVENELEGGVHPGKLILALKKRLAFLGVQILSGIELIQFHTTHSQVELETIIHFNHERSSSESGQLILKAGKLLLCTNAFTSSLLPDIDIIPNRGQVLLTNPIPSLRFTGTFHFDHGYYYFRNLGQRLLIGGARNKAFEAENTLELGTTAIIEDTLLQFIQTHLLPDTPFQITDKWSGIMAMGTEKSPIVKAINDRVFCSVRMSGMGVALAPIVASEVTALMS